MADGRGSEPPCPAADPRLAVTFPVDTKAALAYSSLVTGLRLPKAMCGRRNRCGGGWAPKPVRIVSRFAVIGSRPMMQLPDKQKLDELRAQVDCSKRFRCVESDLSDLCSGRYHAEIDVLECLESHREVCKFARPLGSALVCACPLRKYIARNLDRWSAESTAVLRRDAKQVP